MSPEPLTIRVEVVRALPDRAESVRLELAADSTVRQALAMPQVRALFPAALDGAFGIFGEQCGPLQRLRDGDRIELYRPLLIDPKAARRERARRG